MTKPLAHEVFSAEQWAELRATTPHTLTAEDLARLESYKSYNHALSLDEVTRIYLPLSDLLGLHVRAMHGLRAGREAFLRRASRARPFVIGVAGSVAVGKSTTARVLQGLLSRGGRFGRVELVTTDGFLLPNRVLAERGLLRRKGFPESYDLRRLLQFLEAVALGERELEVPVYSHVVYDVVEGQAQRVVRPDVVILEGLNVLQGPDRAGTASSSDFVSSYLHFGLYVHAEEADIERWFVDRFLALRASARTDPAVYFARYASMTDGEASEFARGVWAGINGVNLRENIAPTRSRADVVLEKGPDHSVQRVTLRRV